MGNGEGGNGGPEVVAMVMGGVIVMVVMVVMVMVVTAMVVKVMVMVVKVSAMVLIVMVTFMRERLVYRCDGRARISILSAWACYSYVPQRW